MPTAPVELVARLERAEASAFASVYTAPRRAGDADLGCRAATINGAIAVLLTAVDEAFFNRVIGFGSLGATTREDVEAASAFVRDAGLGQSLVHLPDEVATPDLHEWLAAAGYRKGRSWVKLWHALDRIADAPTDLRIERVGPEHADGFAAIVVEAMEFPPEVGPMAAWVVGAPGWHHYLGWDGDAPVAAAAMHVEGETAWIGFGATREVARGRGGQSALFAARLRDARELGCTLAVAETGAETDESPVNHSYRNMRRAGFTLAYTRPNFVRIEDPPARVR